MHPGAAVEEAALSSRLPVLSSWYSHASTHAAGDTFLAQLCSMLSAQDYSSRRSNSIEAAAATTIAAAAALLRAQEILPKSNIEAQQRQQQKQRQQQQQQQQPRAYPRPHPALRLTPPLPSMNNACSGGTVREFRGNSLLELSG